MELCGGGISVELCGGGVELCGGDCRIRVELFGGGGSGKSVVVVVVVEYV